MAKQTRFATLGHLKRWWHRFKTENPNIPVSIGFVGFNIPLSERGIIKPTRSGVDASDRDTPFLNNDIASLVAFYYKYEHGKEYKYGRAPYAETIPLKRGEKGFSYGADMNDLSITVLDVAYVPPEHMKEHCDAAIDLFKKLGRIRHSESGQWENEDALRITEWNKPNNSVTLQRATYFDQVGTNLTLDWASRLLGGDETHTLRNNVERHDGGSLQALKDSALANTLGVAAVLVNPDTEEILIPIRGNEQAVMSEGSGLFHCSASGVFHWTDANAHPKELNFDFFEAGIKREIKTELNLERDEYELIPLAFSRELVRGGKPQLFFIAKTHLGMEEVSKRMEDATERWEFIDHANIPSDSELAKYLDSPLDAPAELFTYEGKMALDIAIAYLKKTEPPFSII